MMLEVKSVSHTPFDLQDVVVDNGKSGLPHDGPPVAVDKGKAGLPQDGLLQNRVLRIVGWKGWEGRGDV